MSIFASLGTMHGALDYHLSRHALLTSNLAHVDSPGFKAKELYREGEFSGVLDVEMRATDARHLGASPKPAPWHVRQDPFAPVGPDGNTVNLDREAVKIASNNLRYEAITQLIGGKLESLGWAARDAK